MDHLTKSNSVSAIAFTSSTLAFCLYSHLVRRSVATVRLQIPLAKKLPVVKFFGKHDSYSDQDRGEDLMDPPKERVDDYHWLRDETRKDDTVLQHLKSENEYCETNLSYLSEFRTTLYNEMLSHLKETDQEVPYRSGNYYYYSRTIEGMSYKIHCRRSLDSSEEIIILDENTLAVGHEYTDIGLIDPSPSHNLLTYCVDHSGYETYEVRFKNLEVWLDLPDVITEMSGDMSWGGDDSVVYYLTMDQEHRPYKLWLHELGTPQSEDLCVYTEEDSRYWLGVDLTASKSFLIFGVDSKETSEQYVIDLRGVAGAAAHIEASKRAKCVRPREFGVRYDVEHQGEYFYIVTNKDKAKNSKLIRTPVSRVLQSTSSSDVGWEEIRPYNKEEQIDDILPFAQYIAVFGRSEGVPRVWVFRPSNSLSDWKTLQFSESDCSVWCSANYQYDTTLLRLGYSSFITPKQVLDVDMHTQETVVKKQQTVPGYDASQYVSKRIVGVARDGREVPMSVVHHRDVTLTPSSETETEKKQPNPAVLYGYGSYGICVDPSFDFKRISALDRGVVYVVAHIRGGGEMGRGWYEDEGKYLTKMNTFTDFIDCAKELIKSGITSSDRLGIVGRSAGGLLIGAVVNMAPELFKVAVADVPFVDVMNTMSDPTIPLTVTEWEEWGNPNQEKYFDYMLSYSPYDNVKKQTYPSMLVTAGLNDPRVAYWEPAKWVAKLRELKTNKSPLYFKTDLSTGHFSASDRYKYIRENAFEEAFMLDQIGATLRLDRIKNSE
mmetsp:Transcript_9927/g.10031  ORF Transcript_9927/g.10031 Transcript_9927/m.10031 type:complete len:772 (+) Transcript_9927:26-2341(+)